jgi:dTMP kinase
VRRFIAFEGPEGSGKTLQSGLLGKTLRDTGVEVVLTREPGGTRVGTEIRTVLLGQGDYTILPETEVLLLAAARAQHVREVIRPALERGAWVICDRFIDSTYAYQGGGSGIDLEAIRGVQDFATGGLEPDLRILLDVPVAVGLERRFARPESVNRIDLADVEYHERVRSQYLALAANAPAAWIVIDGQATPESVQSSIKRQLDQWLAIA